jgi:hypothetical protein
MAVTVAQIIEGARDYHASLDPYIHPDQVLIRFLDRYHKTLVLKVAQINPDELSVFQDITLPLADFDTGEAAEAAHQYLSGKAFFLNDTDVWDRLEHLPWESRGRRIHQPAYSVLNGFIRLHGTAADWTQYQSLEIRYIPMTTTLAVVTDPIVLPDTALPCMTAGCAHFLMRRQPDQPYKTYFSELRAEWKEMEITFLHEIAGRKKGQLSQVNEVW